MKSTNDCSAYDYKREKSYGISERSVLSAEVAGDEVGMNYFTSTIAPARITGDLAMVERHVEEGRLHIVRQCRIIERLKEVGGDLAIATALLSMFEQTLVQHEDHRARLLGELDQMH